MKLTPIMGVPIPDNNTRVNQLGAELEAAFTSFEQKIIAAEFPPAQAALVLVAGSAAARDAELGVPATDTARRTLQDSGVTVIRTDRGWTERYFALFHATTNPGGAAVAGWYPIAGRLPYVHLGLSAAQNLAGGGNNTPIAWDLERADPFGYHAAGASTVVLGQAGRYLLQGNVIGAGATTGQFVAIDFRLSGSALPGSYAAHPATNGLLNPRSHNSIEVVATAGATVALAASASTPIPLDLNSTSFQVAYLGPA